MSCLVARLVKGGRWQDLIQFGCHLSSLVRVSLSGFMSSLSTGREIPSFLILAISVVRASPSRTAAPWGPPITQPVSRNACKINARVESLNVFSEEVTVIGVLRGKGLGNNPLFDRITARSIRF
jgi:hypothetical protein